MQLVRKAKNERTKFYWLPHLKGLKPRTVICIKIFNFLNKKTPISMQNRQK